MKLQLVLAIALITLASACNEDSFSQIVDIPFPEHDPLPALSMDMRSGDTAIYARVALSRSVLANTESTDKQALVEIFRDGEPFFDGSFQLTSTDGFNLEYRMPDTLPVGPTAYRVVATVDGFDPVESTQIMPAAANFNLVSYEPDGAIDSDGYRVDEIELDLNDEASTEDYYGFRILIARQFCRYDADRDTLLCTYNFVNANTAYLDSQDPLLKESAGFGLVISDQSFNGGTYRIRLLSDAYQSEGLRLEVFRLTEDAYRYAVSRRAYDDAGDNPFAEPVNIHNNVAGGYGFFIAASRSYLELE